MRLQLNPPPPRLKIKLIRSNPARRYCTKRRTAHLFPHGTCPSVQAYVAAFCDLNHLKE